jgi:hypothetical protein
VVACPPLPRERREILEPGPDARGAEGEDVTEPIVERAELPGIEDGNAEVLHGVG